MITHLLDTDVVIDVLRRRAPEMRQRFERHGSSLAVSTVTVSELAYGAARSSDPTGNAAAVTGFLAHLQVLPFDHAAADHAGDIRAHLGRAGLPIGAYDVLIAGHARSRGLVVATGDLRGLSRVPGLRCEGWRDP